MMRPFALMAYGGGLNASQIYRILRNEANSKGMMSDEERDEFKDQLRDQSWTHYLLNKQETVKFYSSGYHLKLLELMAENEKSGGRNRRLSRGRRSRRSRRSRRRSRRRI